MIIRNFTKSSYYLKTICSIFDLVKNKTHMNLQQKVALITGGSKGIGLAIAKSMIAQGMKVAITGRNLDSLYDAQKSINSESLLIIESDTKEFESNQKAVDLTLQKWGCIDVVIANAGVGYFKEVDQISIEEWNNTIEINLNGAFYILKASVDSLKKSKGYYITIASLAGTNFFEMGAAYNASKFGLVGFTQAAMLDLRKHDIKVSTIMPGSVSTYFNDHTPSDADAWKIQPEDIAQIVLDLLNMPARTLPSKIEVRPSFPHHKGK
jgi:NADP-dependent 3-hydroxy acid dehydrogenase YdfG